MIVIDPKDLIEYKMTIYEKRVWDSFVKEVRGECAKFNIPNQYSMFIDKTIINENKYFSSVKGYSEEYGYYFIDKGDRGALFLTILSKSKDETKFVVLRKILWDIGLKLELDNRKILSSEWHYDYDDVLDGKWLYKENAGNWKYDAIYDSRVFYFTYIIQKLSLVFQDIASTDIATNYISLLSRKNIEFDRFFLEFYLVEDNGDRVVDKKPVSYNMVRFYEKSMIALVRLFEKVEWEHWENGLKIKLI